MRKGESKAVHRKVVECTPVRGLLWQVAGMARKNGNATPSLSLDRPVHGVYRSVIMWMFFGRGEETLLAPCRFDPRAGDAATEVRAQRGKHR